MVDVLIQTFNEEANLETTLASVQGWVRHIYIVDSGSTDGTVAIAERFGATIVTHEFEGYARQKNWALDNVPFESDWILILDADESVTPGLRQEIERVVSRPTESVAEDGFYINRVLVFMGRKIWHCGYYPSWNLRLIKHGRMRYEDRLVHEHMIGTGPTGYLENLLIHEDRRGLEHFFAKHNRYSTLEAVEIVRHPEPWPGVRRLFTNRTLRRRWGKSQLLTWLPVPWLWRFIYMYLIRGGFMTGPAGWRLCWSISFYELQVQMKVKELRASNGRAKPTEAALARPEGRHSVVLADGEVMPATPPGDVTKVSAGADPLTPVPTVVWAKRDNREPGSSDHAYEMIPQFTSPWTFRQNLARAAWMMVAKLLFRPSFHNWYAWRRLLLRGFGARIGRDVRIRPSASIEIPWNLDIHDGVVVGDFAILYSLGKITIGQHTVVSQYAHLCAGTHDSRYADFPLLRPPITIGADAWIAADAFVGPGVMIGDRSVLGARSSAFSDLPADTVAVGSPAKPIKAREMITR